MYAECNKYNKISRIYDYDSNASPICYVYQVRRHEATSASICICMCLIFLFLCTATQIQIRTNTQTHEWQLAPSHMPIVSHWIMRKMHFLHYVYNSVECIQKSIITHSEEIDAAVMNDVLNNLYAFVYAVTDWCAIIKTRYVVIFRISLNAALSDYMNCQFKNRQKKLFLQREQRVSKNPVYVFFFCSARILLIWVQSRTKHVVFVHHSRIRPRMVNKNNHQ